MTGQRFDEVLNNLAKIGDIEDVARWRLCLGCGACAYICPLDKVVLRDLFDEGIRPKLNGGSDECESCGECLDVCPALENDHTAINKREGVIEELVESFGPVLEVWEGYAADPEIRFKGSSGGVLTALSAYCVEEGGMHGVLHIGQDESRPWTNSTFLSRTRAELLSRTGSRYAPASACDRLDLIEEAAAPCVFIGQPSEASAVRKAVRLRPGLSEKMGIVLSFFCAGSPSTRGTVEVLRSLGVDPGEVEGYRYRGNGWPGNFSAKLEGVGRANPETSYRQSWSIAQAFRPLSTHLCPDGSGEDADISCGDPWYQEIEDDDPGRSLVLVRTEAGRRLVHAAIKAGYVHLTPAEPWKVSKSQEGLTAKRGAVGGRVSVMRLLGLPTPRLRGFSLLKNWLALGCSGKLRSTVGTVRRVLKRGYTRPLSLDQMKATGEVWPKKPNLESMP